MATMSWGTPVQYVKIKSLTENELKTTANQVGKIYTEVHKYTKISLTTQTLTKTEFDRAVKTAMEKFQGKAKLLYAKINSADKTITIQYTPTVSFFPPILLALGIVAALALIIGLLLKFAGAEVGDFVSKAVTTPIVGGITNILTSPWVIGGLLVAGGGYYLLKNPSKIGEIRREIYARQ